MKKSMILDVVNGDNDYFDNINMSDNEEYKKCLAEIRKMLEKFCNGMSEEEKDKTLWKFETAQGGLEATTANKYFKEGFKLGLIIAAQNFLD